MHAENRTIQSIAPALQAREITSEAITEACLAEIAAKNPTLNAFITVLADDARAQARESDREMNAGRYRGPLHGVPLSLKDLLDLRGTTTTAASRVREGHIAQADAPAVARLREAGAVFVGKCNLHEFALGTTNEDSAFGAAHHPLDASRSPGGSSGGSAISVATGMAFASIGTDTGGSIRIPSAACGLVGLKPSLREVPTGGVVPLSPTMDHVGPLCRSVDDAALLFDVLRGAQPGGLRPASDARGVRLAIPRGYFFALLDQQVASSFDLACERLRNAGVIVDDADIPHASDIAAVYLHIVLAEAAAYHAKTLESRADEYTQPVRLRLEMGRYILAEDYIRALRGREVLRREVSAVLEGRDGLLLPSLAVPATKLGVSAVRVGGLDEPVRNITLRLTQLFNVTGHPAVTVPCGATVEGLPIGAQLVGHLGRTTELLHVARATERYLRGIGG
ncbi:MAG TPA: amidase [Vicinamibacterales bacterium]|jgi:aspartyl-tRNA(Asn)/glutamyl-tRNA(Gln) amidotransferase subunit A|nr:amidase [Vicinamibacterales bacterium]